MATLPRPGRAPAPPTIALARYRAVTAAHATTANELSILVADVEQLAGQLSAVTAERDTLAADLAEARTLLEALRQVDAPTTVSGPPPSKDGPIPSAP